VHHKVSNANKYTHYIYTPWAIKGATFIFTITLANVASFLWPTVYIAQVLQKRKRDNG